MLTGTDSPKENTEFGLRPWRSLPKLSDRIKIMAVEFEQKRVLLHGGKLGI